MPLDHPPQTGCNLDFTQYEPKPLVGAVLPIEAYGRNEAVPLISGHNDEYGDCVETGIYNGIQTEYGDRGNYVTLGNDAPLDLYGKVSPFILYDDQNDNGTDPIQAFNYWMSNKIAGTILKSVSHLQVTDELQLRNAIARHKYIFIVVGLSKEMQANLYNWSPIGTPGTWGQHFVIVDAFDGSAYYCTSWGKRVTIDRSFFNTPGFVLAAFAAEIEICA